ncbi:hypothetical protein L249_7565 [Ophiocordyceps polyrhachis-furcata BCC 54312]|uniref:Uncharacterized protein n=1 Tax=Ophiocordyceps polyrhachis-furcata BCC 54312 TaxID=1330021 RepID=A0A367LAV5_9HYPO|nr:hypothetical protein L249_7565 [Ophiocordyceps polyrhachis-furcata BCC 54312]
MASPKLKAEKISRPDFDALLAQYPTLLQATSKAKAGTPSRRAETDDDKRKKSLAELDEYRYVKAPSIFGPESRLREMLLEDVKLLVEWKLLMQGGGKSRHGTFRPKLLSLVSSNAASTVQKTIQEAIATTSSSSSPTTTALTKLTSLKGIGPATASLLLSVHDPSRYIFFSDEAFRWLCRGGDAGAPIRYTVAEYRALDEAAASVARRLGVEAVELEKVAYVLMRRGEGHDLSAKGHQREPSPVNEVRRSKRLKRTKKKHQDQPTTPIFTTAAATTATTTNLSSSSSFPASKWISSPSSEPPSSQAPSPPPPTTFLTTLITSRSPPPPFRSLLATAKARLLASDLTSSSPSLFDPSLLSALPPDATSATAASVRLTRDTHVQVLDVEDLSLSRWEQAEALREVARGERTSGRQIVRVEESVDGGDADEAQQQRPAANEPSRRHDNATHRLVLQDCRGTRVYAVELRRLPRIGVRSTAVGEKILLRAGTVVARGTVLLAPESCLLLGGRVDAWHDVWASSRLQRLEEAADN